MTTSSQTARRASPLPGSAVGSTRAARTREENQAATNLVTQLSKGQKPTKVVNDPKQNNNGQKVVPAVELNPVLVTKANAVEAYANNSTLEALAKKG